MDNIPFCLKFNTECFTYEVSVYLHNSLKSRRFRVPRENGVNSIFMTVIILRFIEGLRKAKTNQVGTLKIMD